MTRRRSPWKCQKCGALNDRDTGGDSSPSCSECAAGELASPPRAPGSLMSRFARVVLGSRTRDGADVGPSSGGSNEEPLVSIEGTDLEEVETRALTPRTALARLREPYGEARDLVSPTGSYEDLEWILGAKRHPERSQDLDHRIVAIVALWLQDLATEVDRRFPPQSAVRVDPRARVAYQGCLEVAARLRAATKAFVTAYRVADGG